MPIILKAETSSGTLANSGTWYSEDLTIIATVDGSWTGLSSKYDIELAEGTSASSKISFGDGFYADSEGTVYAMSGTPIKLTYTFSGMSGQGNDGVPKGKRSFIAIGHTNVALFGSESYTEYNTYWVDKDPPDITIKPTTIPSPPNWINATKIEEIKIDISEPDQHSGIVETKMGTSPDPTRVVNYTEQQVIGSTTKYIHNYYPITLAYDGPVISGRGQNIYVIAKDNAGNEENQKYTFDIDVDKPKISYEITPAGSEATITVADIHSGVDKDSVYYIKHNSGTDAPDDTTTGWQHVDPSNLTTTGTGYSFTIAKDTPGQHTWVKAKDIAGNVTVKALSTGETPTITIESRYGARQGKDGNNENATFYGYYGRMRIKIEGIDPDSTVYSCVFIPSGSDIYGIDPKTIAEIIEDPSQRNENIIVTEIPRSAGEAPTTTTRRFTLDFTYGTGGYIVQCIVVAKADDGGYEFIQERIYCNNTAQIVAVNTDLADFLDGRATGLELCHSNGTTHGKCEDLTVTGKNHMVINSIIVNTTPAGLVGSTQSKDKYQVTAFHHPIDKDVSVGISTSSSSVSPHYIQLNLNNWNNGVTGRNISNAVYVRGDLYPKRIAYVEVKVR